MKRRKRRDRTYYERRRGGNRRASVMEDLVVKIGSGVELSDDLLGRSCRVCRLLVV